MVNEQIRAREVRLIGKDGEQLGIVNIREALRIAQEHELDVVNVAPTAKPPVCKIMDYGRYRYEQSKREKESRRNQKTIDVKEVKMRPTIDEHDFQVKLKNAYRFLADGDKVKVTITFRGREITHADLAHKLMNRIAQEVAELGSVERKPKVEGRNMIMILTPKQD
jgi:translation initiation factor IF-3